MVWQSEHEKIVQIPLYPYFAHLQVRRSNLTYQKMHVFQHSSEVGGRQVFWEMRTREFYRWFTRLGQGKKGLPILTAHGIDVNDEVRRSPSLVTRCSGPCMPAFCCPGSIVLFGRCRVAFGLTLIGMVKDVWMGILVLLLRGSRMQIVVPTWRAPRCVTRCLF